MDVLASTPHPIVNTSHVFEVLVQLVVEPTFVMYIVSDTQACPAFAVEELFIQLRDEGCTMSCERRTFPDWMIVQSVDQLVLNSLSSYLCPVTLKSEGKSVFRLLELMAELRFQYLGLLLFCSESVGSCVNLPQ